MELKIGDQAPAFEAQDQNGKTVKLADFKGQKVVIYFYPKDDTPGCTAQACNLRDNYADLQAKGYVILGVSGDKPNTHQRFIAKYNLPFTLLSDPDRVLHEKFGTWRLKNMFGKSALGTMRHTFIIDEEGKIENIIKRVKTKAHTAQILK